MGRKPRGAPMFGKNAPPPKGRRPPNELKPRGAPMFGKNVPPPKLRKPTVALGAAVATGACCAWPRVTLESVSAPAIANPTSHRAFMVILSCGSSLGSASGHGSERLRRCSELVALRFEQQAQPAPSRRGATPCFEL